MTAITHAQLYCTVADLIADMQAPGADEIGLLQRIREASDYLQKEIGWFIPITQTLKFNGRGRDRLLVPALLSVSSIVNDGVTLATSDYILQPDGRFWGNGPYGELRVDPDATNLNAWMDEEEGVEIAGNWGLYDLSKATGATVQDDPKQTSSQTTLKVSNGAKLSLGAVLLIGSEQELVTGWDAPIDSTTNADGIIAAGDQVVKLSSVSGLNIGEIIRLDLEQMRLLDIATTTKQLRVARGWNKTPATAHIDTTDVYVYRTVTVERAVNGTTAAEHLKDVVISRYQVPDDILFLTKEIATLMLNKAKSQYQGRTGNEQGVIFYNDAFPKQDIERVKQAYMLKRVA